MSLLEIRELVAGYGPIRVLHGISLNVDSGEVVALLGRNGAGKTTTLKAVFGMAKVFAGQVIYRERDITHLPAYRRARQGMGYVPEDRRIFGELTTRENLQIARKAGAGNRPWNEERVYELMPWMKDIEHRLGGFLSGGEQQMLAIARALMGNPEVLLLDEPTEGLAPQFVQLIGDLVLELKHSGTTVLLAEQNLKFIERLADRVYVLESGELRLSGTVAEMAQKEEVRTLLAL